MHPDIPTITTFFPQIPTYYDNLVKVGQRRRTLSKVCVVVGGGGEWHPTLATPLECRPCVRFYANCNFEQLAYKSAYIYVRQVRREMCSRLDIRTFHERGNFERAYVITIKMKTCWALHCNLNIILLLTHCGIHPNPKPNTSSHLGP